MKKVILTLAIVLGTITLTQAQDNAIGLRLGYGGEISFQKALGSNRLELDLGMALGYGFNLTGVYQWTWDLAALADGFKWYAGVGASVAYWNGKNGFAEDNYLNVGVAGQIGIEYNFSIPLQISLDYRPIYFFLNDGYGWYDGICLGIRYKF